MSETPPQDEPERRARSRWPRIAGWSALGLIVLLGLGVTWLFTADLGMFKPQIERLVTERTGRAFRIDGELDIEIGNLTTIRAENVSFANAAWADEALMLQIGRFDFHFDLWSVFKDTFIVEHINVDDAVVRLVTIESGDANWRLGAGEPRDPEAGRRDFDFHIKQMDIDRVDLYFDSPRRSEPLTVRFESLDQAYRQDDYLDVSVDGAVGGRRVSASGQVGTWANLLSGTNVNYYFTGQLDTITLASSGTIDSLIDPHRPNLSFTVVGPDIDDLTRMFGAGVEGVGDIGLYGTLDPRNEGPLVLSVTGNVGASEIEAEGRFSDLSDLTEVDLDLLVRGPDLSRILKWVGVDRVREGPYMIDIDARRRGAEFDIDSARMVFGEAQFDLTAALPNFPTLDDATISLDINGPDIERFRYVFDLPGSATGEFSLSAGLDVSPTGEETIRLTSRTSLGEVRANGTLGPAPDYLGTTLEVHASVDSLADSLQAFARLKLPDESADLQGQLRLTEDGIRIVDTFTIRIEDASALVEGTIAPTARLVGSVLTFEATGPDLAATVGGFGPNEHVPIQPFTAKGRFEIREDGFRLGDVTGTLGTSAFSGDGLLVPRRWIVGSRFDVRASGSGFEDLFSGLPGARVRPGDYELSGRVEFEDGRLLFTDVSLVRESGSLEGDVTLGLPVSRRFVEFDIDGEGRDVSELLQEIRRFEPDKSPFSLAAIGRWDDRVWDLERLQFSIGDATMMARGNLNFTEQGASTSFVFEGEVPSLAALGTYNGYRMRDMPLDWAARVTGSDGRLQVENMDVHLGDSDIRGGVSYQIGDVPTLKVDVYSDSIAFVSLMEPKEEEDYDPEPEYPDGRLIPDVPIPFDRLAKMNASLDIDVGAFQRDNLDLTSIEIQMNLEDGVLDVPQFGFNAKAGRFDMRARLDPADGEGRANLEIIARDFALGLSEMNRDVAMTGDMDVKFESTGNDLRTLFANLNGVLLIATRGGRIVNNVFLQRVYGDVVQEVFGAINPFHETDPVTHLECVVLPYSIDDGVTKSHPNGFVRTNKIQFVTSGTLNLGNERIDVNVRTTPRRGITISAGEILNPFVKVVGTLAQPRLAVDEQGVLITGGAAVATGGLTILARALWDRLSRSSDPCGDVLEEAHEKLGDRFPDWEDEIPVDSAGKE